MCDRTQCLKDHIINIIKRALVALTGSTVVMVLCGVRCVLGPVVYAAGLGMRSAHRYKTGSAVELSVASPSSRTPLDPLGSVGGGVIALHGDISGVLLLHAVDGRLDHVLLLEVLAFLGSVGWSVLGGVVLVFLSGDGGQLISES